MRIFVVQKGRRSLTQGAHCAHSLRLTQAPLGDSNLLAYVYDRLRETFTLSMHANIKIPDNSGWQDGSAQGSTLLPDAGTLTMTPRDALFQAASAASPSSITRASAPLLARH